MSIYKLCTCEHLHLMYMYIVHTCTCTLCISEQVIVKLGLYNKSPFHTTQKKHRFLETNFTSVDSLSYHPMSDCFHTTQSKNQHSMRLHTLLSVVMQKSKIKNCHTQICAAKNVVNVKTNYIITLIS